MKAIVRDRYGSPDVLELREIEKPELTDDGMLVRVRASSVNPVDWHLMRGEPYLLRLSDGLRRPKEFFLAQTNREDMLVLKELLEMGKITPVIDRTYPLKETAEAIRYLETGHARGKVVITV
jgi:NADPH:quinone reductase-like Zn-dependent oxidoreductase